MANNLPDWMREDEDWQNQQEKAEPRSDLDDDVSEAAAGKRPESILPGDPENFIEELANLRQRAPLDSLPEDRVTQGLFGKLLQVSDQERVRASIFNRLIDSEGIRAPVQIPSTPPLSPALRILTIIIILGAVLLPQLLEINRKIFSPPDVTPGILQVFRLIGELPPGEAVLLAVEFEPGFSGEMNAIAVPILNQLFNKQALLAVISTLPTGPAQAEILMRLSEYNQPPFQSDTMSYANFGYLPGGQVGLQNLLQTPQSIFLAGQELLSTADRIKINQINSLSDFALIMVVTDRPEVARDWIEQIQPSRIGTPVLMVLSAQAGPVVHPYIEANPGQIQGMIVGLGDGLSYASLTDQFSIPVANWISFNLGLVAAIILVGSAGAWSLVSAISNDRPKPD